MIICMLFDLLLELFSSVESFTTHLTIIAWLYILSRNIFWPPGHSPSSHCTSVVRVFAYLFVSILSDLFLDLFPSVESFTTHLTIIARLYRLSWNILERSQVTWPHRSFWNILHGSSNIFYNWMFCHKSCNHSQIAKIVLEHSSNSKVTWPYRRFWNIL